MKFSTLIDETTGTVKLEGRFTFESHQAFKAATGPLLESPDLKLMNLDLSAVNYMDSSSLGMVLLLRERADLKGITIVLQRPSPSVMAILKVVQFGKLFQIEI